MEPDLNHGGYPKYFVHKHHTYLADGESYIKSVDISFNLHQCRQFPLGRVLA